MANRVAIPDALKDHPARDDKWERILNDRAFDYEFKVDVPLTKIDETRSQHNQARIGNPIDQELLDGYTTALRSGDEFPAIVIADQGLKPYLIVDGNHREQAYKACVKKDIPAYIIYGASPSAITLLTFEANAKHGKQTSADERIYQASHLMDGGVSAETAARMLGVKVSALRTHAQLQAVDRRADDVGISRQKWEKLPAGVRQRLGQVSTDEGFVHAAKLAMDADLKSDAVTRMVNDLNQQRSSQRQVAHISGLRSVYRDTIQTAGANSGKAPKSGRQARSPRVLYGMFLAQATILPPASSIVAKMNENDKVEWTRRTDDAIAALQRIRDELKK